MSISATFFSHEADPANSPALGFLVCQQTSKIRLQALQPPLLRDPVFDTLGEVPPSAWCEPIILVPFPE